MHVKYRKHTDMSEMYQIETQYFNDVLSARFVSKLKKGKNKIIIIVIIIFSCIILYKKIWLYFRERGWIQLSTGKIYLVVAKRKSKIRNDDCIKNKLI